jgi:hypothetical protein
MSQSRMNRRRRAFHDKPLDRRRSQRVTRRHAYGIPEALSAPEGPFPDYGTETGSMSGGKLVAWPEGKPC